MNIDLGITIRSLRQTIDSFFDPIDLFRIVNCVSPRDWAFKLTFDQAGQNYLHIQPTPALTEGEIRTTLNGEFPALFAFDSLAIQLRDTQFVCQSPIRGHRDSETQISFRETKAPMASQISLGGVSVPCQLTARPSLGEWLRRNTWLGSYRYQARTHSLQFQVFGEAIGFTPRDLACTLPDPSYKTECTLHLEEAEGAKATIICCPPGPRHQIRHEVFGGFDPAIAVPGFWKGVPFRTSCSIYIELSCSLLRWHTAYGPFDLGGTRRVLSACLQELQSVSSSEKFLHYLKRLQERKRGIEAERIGQRQDSLDGATWVSFRGRRFMREPHCENELVALYMKLEAVGALPFDCTILEYTRKAGIDALGDFRLRGQDALQRRAPVEFEYILENFLAHGHPPGQTRLVLCWDSEEGYVESDSSNEGQIHWVREIEVEGYPIPAVLLKYIPGLSLDMAAAGRNQTAQ